MNVQNIQGSLVFDCGNNEEQISQTHMASPKQAITEFQQVGYFFLLPHPQFPLHCAARQDRLIITLQYISCWLLFWQTEDCRLSGVVPFMHAVTLRFLPPYAGTPIIGGIDVKFAECRTDLKHVHEAVKPSIKTLKRR